MGSTWIALVQWQKAISHHGDAEKTKIQNEFILARLSRDPRKSAEP
jgi:hypothetical protein